MRDHHPIEPHKGVSVHLSARIGAYCTIDGGYENETWIGADTWLMKGCHVGHDAVIGPNVEMAPHCVIGGYARILKGAKLGMDVIVKPYVVIGENAQLGMGAVVTRDVPAGQVWVGNPATFLCLRNPTNPLWPSYNGA